jgi:hypothetical protein
MSCDIKMQMIVLIMFLLREPLEASSLFRKSSRFIGHRIFQNIFALSIEFVSAISGASWVLTNIYAPCTTQGR